MQSPFRPTLVAIALLTLAAPLALVACTDAPATTGDAAPSDAPVSRDAASSDAPTRFDAALGDGATPADAALGDGASGDAASAPTCPAGATLLVDDTACPGTPSAIPTSLASDLAAATRGDVVSLGAWAEEGAPCLPVLLCTPLTAPTMVFSDEPEAPSQDGVLYADVVGPGAVRAYVYHANGGASARRFSVVLLAQTATAHVQVTARGVAGPSQSYIATGKQAALDWLASPAGAAITIAQGQRVVLDADLDGRLAATDELVHAIIDFTVDQPVKLSVVTVGAGVDTASATAGLALLANTGQHLRGTFPGADLLIEGTAPIDAVGARRLRLGGNVSDPDLPGHDAVDQLSVTLGGNYGVVYRFHLATAARAALAVSARGGAWGGAALVSTGEDATEGTLLVPAATEALTTTTDAALLGRFTAGDAPFLRLVSAGGSNLPIDLFAAPLP